MQQRISSLNAFVDNLKKDLKIFTKMLSFNSGKIYLVVSNAECTRNTIINIMSLYAPGFITINKNEISVAGDLSSSIYSHIAHSANKSLLLDFSNICVGSTTLKDFELHLLEEINANRDIFINHFGNTVIMFPCSMSYWLQTMARDICSCISFYFDMTDWFIIPEDIPIFHIKLPYFSSNVSLSRNSFESAARYIALKQKILSLRKYIPDVERTLLKEINMLDEVYRSELLCLLLKKLCAIPASSVFARNKAVATWDFNSMDCVSTAQANCYAGEFWYINGNFEKAAFHFRSAISIIDCEIRKSPNIFAQIEGYQPFLACDKMICLLQSGMSHDDSNLLKTLTRVLNDVCIEENDIVIKMYAESYLFIYNICLGNCNYVTLLDLCERENSRVQANDYANVNIYKNILMWVHYIVYERFSIPDNLDTMNSWAQLHLTMITMVHNFRIGGYSDATYFYNKAKRRINELGHTQMRGILKSIRKNMLFLKTLEEKTRDIATLEDFLQD